MQSGGHLVIAAAALSFCKEPNESGQQLGQIRSEVISKGNCSSNTMSIVVHRYYCGDRAGLTASKGSVTLCMQKKCRATAVMQCCRCSLLKKKKCKKLAPKCLQQQSQGAL